MNAKRWQDLVILTKNGETKICGTDKKNQEAVLHNLSTSAEDLYAECLIDLEKFFVTDGEKAFYQAFAYAYWESYFKQKKNKGHYWDLKSLAFSLIGAGGGGAFFLTSFFTLLNTVISNLMTLESNSEGTIAQCIAFAEIYWLPCLLLLVGWMFMRFSLTCFKQGIERHNYRETWVRHSITYHRLNIAMVQFLSGMIKEKSEFMEKVLEILGGNITRFQHNMTVQKAVGGENAPASKSSTSTTADTSMCKN